MAGLNAQPFTPYSEQKALHGDAPYRSSMLTFPGNLRQALEDAKADASKTLLGIAHGIPSTFVTKLIALPKPDFIWIDAEHAMFDRLALHDAIQAAQHHSEGHTMVIVRTSKHDEVGLTTALDAGAAGFVIPHTESAEEVRKVMNALYFPPIGQRSFSPWVFTPGRTTSLWENDPYNVTTYNNHICVIPQIESVKGLENIDEIASIPGIHALMFGPGDFMIDAGIDIARTTRGDPEPAFLQAMGKFAAAAKKYNVPIYGGVGSAEQIPRMIAMGARAIVLRHDFWAFQTLIGDLVKEGREKTSSFEGVGFDGQKATKAGAQAMAEGEKAPPQVEEVKTNGEAAKTNGEESKTNGDSTVVKPS